MTDEKNREMYRLNKIRGKLLPKLYAKLDKVNVDYRKKYPLDCDLICSITDVSITMLDKGYIATITLHESRGLLGYKYKLHGSTINDSVNNFGNDYKKLLEIVKDNQIKINNCIYQEVLKSRLEKEK